MPQRRLESTGERNVKSRAMPNVYERDFRHSEHLPLVPHNHILRQEAHCHSCIACQFERDRCVVCRGSHENVAPKMMARKYTSTKNVAVKGPVKLAERTAG